MSHIPNLFIEVWDSETLEWRPIYTPKPNPVQTERSRVHSEFMALFNQSLQEV